MPATLVPTVIKNASATWGESSRRERVDDVVWNEATISELNISVFRQRVDEMSSGVLSAWDRVATKEISAVDEWGTQKAVHAQPEALRWGTKTIVDAAPALALWDLSVKPLRTKFLFQYLNVIPSIDKSSGGRWQDLTRTANSKIDKAHKTKWIGIPPNKQDSYKLPWGFGHSAYKLDPYIGIKYPDYTGPITPPGEPDLPEDKPSYIIMNTVQINELAGGTPLLAENASISIDIDSFVWTFSCDLLNRASLTMVEPTGAGLKEIEVLINGYRWVFMIERYDMSAQFPAERYRVYGVSRTQYLGSPYAPKQTKKYTQTLQAQQIVNEEINPAGFTSTWEAALPNWTVDANIFGYNGKTPIEVVSEIVDAVGAIVVPETDIDQIAIKQRYKALPWNWDAQATGALDNIVSESMVLSLSLEWQPDQSYNAVYISGIEAGRAVNVVRNGTAGDRPAPDIVGTLYLDEQQIAEKGRSVLASGGNQSVVTIQVPLPPGQSAPGLFRPGNFIEYRNSQGAAQFRALCLSNTISISGTGAANVTQNIKLERHH